MEVKVIVIDDEGQSWGVRREGVAEGDLGDVIGDIADAVQVYYDLTGPAERRRQHAAE